ncbi:hypothetical protein LJK88_04350 [Paenibacillus sp. P26]|nr:hypothetical protein LJK88_04350 [Paenibacillus sp. P26]UUZ97845.1 hypothetical protein LJK87_33165 [Paenibacillus sp. P25]
MRKWVIAGLVAAMICSPFTVTASAASNSPSFVGVVMDGQKSGFPMRKHLSMKTTGRSCRFDSSRNRWARKLDGSPKP